MATQSFNLTQTSIPKPMPDLDEIRRACKVVISGVERGRTVEVRALKTSRGTCSGYFSNSELIQNVFNLSPEETTPNVYWTIQDLSRLALPLEKENAIESGVRETTGDHQVRRYVYLPIDCDPNRPAGTSATGTEKARAHDLACAIRDFLSIQYGIESILADSGNGYHVLVRIDLAVSDTSIKLVRDLLIAFHAKFGTAEVSVDTKVFNPSRILKVYGTVARKGEHTDERPWRISRLLEVPDSIEVVPEEQFRALLADLTKDLPAARVAEVRRENAPANPASKDLISEYRNNTLTSIAGTLRHNGLEEDEIYTRLTRINEERCQPMLPEHEIKSISKSIGKKPAGDPVRDSPAALMFSKEPSKPRPTDIIQVPSEEELAAERETVLDGGTECARPLFPSWVMDGTTLYDNLVAPAVELSSKYGEFIFMAGVQALLNYVSLRVRVKDNEVALNLYLGFVSPYGQFFKSSCAELAHKYFEEATMLADVKLTTMMAEGKVLVSQAGSPEGFCLAMDRANGRNGIMYSDELAHVVNKASIESSSYVDALLAFYEQGKYSNLVKDLKKCVALEAKKYCYSWLWCTTDRSFDRHWPKLAGDNSGLVDRMFFVVSPAKPRPTTVYRNPYFGEAALKTRRAVDKALEQGVYAFEDAAAVEKLLAGMDPRSMQLVQKLALYFAIDLQRDSIDGDCVKRALALVDYRNAATRFLDPPEADNELGRLQTGVKRTLRRNGGRMTYRELCRRMDNARFGTALWGAAVTGLIKAGDVIEWNEKTAAGRNKHMVGLRKWKDEDDE